MFELLGSAYSGFQELFGIARRYQALIYSGTLLGLVIAVVITR